MKEFKTSIEKARERFESRMKELRQRPGFQEAWDMATPQQRADFLKKVE